MMLELWDTLYKAFLSWSFSRLYKCPPLMLKTLGWSTFTWLLSWLYKPLYTYDTGHICRLCRHLFSCQLHILRKPPVRSSCSTVTLDTCPACCKLYTAPCPCEHSAGCLDPCCAYTQVSSCLLPALRGQLLPCGVQNSASLGYIDASVYLCSTIYSYTPVPMHIVPVIHLSCRLLHAL